MRVVAGSPIRSTERAEEIRVLTGLRLGAAQDRQSVIYRALSQQGVAEPNLCVDVCGVFGQHRSESRLGLRRLAETQIQPGDPQPGFGIRRILVNDLLEQLDGLDSSAGPGELLGAHSEV
jgi:hypothetical protein